MRQLLLGDVIRTNAERYPRRTAIALQDRHMTFAEVALAADRVAAGLLARGVRRGDRVGWWAPTSLEAIPVLFGCAHVGAMFTPLNPAGTDAEIDAVLGLADPAVVVTLDERSDHLTY